MALENYLEPEIAITAGVTAALVSPRARNTLRKAAVWVLAAGLALADRLRGAGQRVQDGLARRTVHTTAQPEGVS